MIIGFRLKGGDREVAVCNKPEEIATMKWMKTKVYGCEEAYKSAVRVGGEAYLSDEEIPGWIRASWGEYDTDYFRLQTHGVSTFFGHIEKAILNVGFNPTRKNGVFCNSNMNVGRIIPKVTYQELYAAIYDSKKWKQLEDKYFGEKPVAVEAKQ